MNAVNIILETKRLILKQPILSDFDGLLQLRTDPQVMQYIGTGDIQTENQVKEFIENAKLYSDEYGLGFYSVFEKETNDFIGQAGLFHLGFNVNQPDIELAYILHTKYWNKGYATELANFSRETIELQIENGYQTTRKIVEKTPNISMM